MKLTKSAGILLLALVLICGCRTPRTHAQYPEANERHIMKFERPESHPAEEVENLAAEQPEVTEPAVEPSPNPGIIDGDEFSVAVIVIDETGIIPVDDKAKAKLTAGFNASGRISRVIFANRTLLSNNTDNDEFRKIATRLGVDTYLLCRVMYDTSLESKVMHENLGRMLTSWNVKAVVSGSLVDASTGHIYFTADGIESGKTGKLGTELYRLDIEKKFILPALDKMFASALAALEKMNE